MKKSKLRSIVREVINEQFAPKNITYCRCSDWNLTTQTCDTTPTVITGMSFNPVGTSGNGPMVMPQVGDKFCAGFTPGTNTGLAANCGGWNSPSIVLTTANMTGNSGQARHLLDPNETCGYTDPNAGFEIDLQIEQCDGTIVPNLTGCIHLDGVYPTPNDVGKVFALFQMGDKTPHIINGVTVTTTPCTGPTIFATSVPACPGSIGYICNVSNPFNYPVTPWANHLTWISAWTTGGPFNSTNPNQPCNHICNQITNWSATQMTAGPVQANQLACKIDEGYNQSQIHGCNC